MLRSRLFAKYALVMVALVAATLAAVAAVQLLIIRDAQRTQIERTLQAQSEAARDKIAAFMSGIVASVSDLNDFDQPGAAPDVARIRDEAYRVMRRNDAITRVLFVDGARCRAIRVSRMEPDAVADCRNAPAPAAALLPDAAKFDGWRTKGTSYSAVYYPDGSEPHIDVTVASRGEGTGAVTAQVSLKRIHDTVSAIRVGRAGIAFVVDERRRLIAHPDIALALKQMDVARLPQVAEAFSAPNPQRSSRAVLGEGPEGREVLTSWSSVGEPGWRVFVELPAREAFEPLYQSLLASLAGFAVAVALAVAASFVLARRLSGPIVALRHGAQRIGEGDLGARIDVRSGDEVAALGEEFNRMAARLQESYAELERRVVERTGELSAANVELVRLKQEADAASAAKTRFLASASHDLRQPMHAISLLVGLLHERVVTEQDRPLVEKVMLSVEAMENLFSSLLDISRLDAGAVKPQAEAFDISGLMRLLQMRFAAQAAQKGIELRVMPCRATVRSDPALLERIVGNLVANAIRYTERGRVIVGCRRRRGELHVIVADTGVGIAAADMELVFEEFFQVANPERDRSQGLGLGLSIVKRTASLLGHPLIARSTPGRGSMFGIVVPLAPAHALPAPPEAPASDAGALRNAFVLVIDDDHESRYAMERLCAQWGCHVEAAGSAEDAIRRLQSHLRDPDLILCDYRLPSHDGLQAVRSIRRERDAAIPAIIVTGDVGAVEGRRLDPGVSVLHKPVNAERLKAAAASIVSAIALR